MRFHVTRKVPRLKRISRPRSSLVIFCGDLGAMFGYRLKDDDPKFWQKILPRIEIIAHNTLSKFGHHPGRSPSAVDNQDMGIVRVHQISDIIKMVRDAILSGSLKSNHIELQDIWSEKKCGANSGSSAIISEQVFVKLVCRMNMPG
ncbi:hypothetical protein LWI29_035249 [Acer saccharum]|uniref:Uncharacterized protein n=1 Tax=Acer saccharum TaxID=4024 RepID=A0AA39S738_ACESA|nr:hypothetical protein LWI29_035249 [Acer saccharum]